MTQPISVKANTATSKLQVPQAAPSGITLNTGPVPQKANIDRDSTWVGIGGDLDEEEEGFPKWAIYAISGVVALILIIVAASSMGGDDEDVAGGPGTEEEELTLPSGEELIKQLRLPESVTALIQRRDKNKDGQLTIDEFAYAPTKALLEELRKYFPLIDLDGDGLLSPSELNRAYHSKG